LLWKSRIPTNSSQTDTLWCWSCNSHERSFLAYITCSCRCWEAWRSSHSFCTSNFLHLASTTSPCTEISNYMVHLLFANPEILIPGSRRILFTYACNELEAIGKMRIYHC
jgi:hypothetical protein